jgi:hypothetical protein
MSELYQVEGNTYTLQQIEEIAIRAIKESRVIGGKDYRLTDITLEGLGKGLGTVAFWVTVCPVCGFAYLDGIEGNAEDSRCDDCWARENEISIREIEE